MDFYEIGKVSLRLLLACVIGVIFGYRSYRKGKPAGLKTHMLVAGASALVMLLGTYYMGKHPSVDPTRLAAQVISGIGFIGAGTIIKDGFSARGITTAASIWACACLGLACGAGYYVGAIVCMLFMLIIMTVCNLLENRIDRKKTREEKEEIVHSKDHDDEI